MLPLNRYSGFKRVKEDGVGTQGGSRSPSPNRAPSPLSPVNGTQTTVFPLIENKVIRVPDGSLVGENRKSSSASEDTIAAALISLRSKAAAQPSAEPPKKIKKVSFSTSVKVRTFERSYEERIRKASQTYSPIPFAIAQLDKGEFDMGGFVEFLGTSDIDPFTEKGLAEILREFEQLHEENYRAFLVDLLTFQSEASSLTILHCPYLISTAYPHLEKLLDGKHVKEIIKILTASSGFSLADTPLHDHRVVQQLLPLFRHSHLSVDNMGELFSKTNSRGQTPVMANPRIQRLIDPFIREKQ